MVEKVVDFWTGHYCIAAIGVALYYRAVLKGMAATGGSKAVKDGARGEMLRFG